MSEASLVQALYLEETGHCSKKPGSFSVENDTETKFWVLEVHIAPEVKLIPDVLVNKTGMQCEFKRDIFLSFKINKTKEANVIKL